ncbi:unnamed protein product, partial [Rotaria magnacalcarata]
MPRQQVFLLIQFL